MGARNIYLRIGGSLIAASLYLLAPVDIEAADWRTAPIDWPNPLLKEGVTQQVSEHVHVIPDGGIRAVANIGIVVGTRGILIIDTGIGRRNGEIIMREVHKFGHHEQLLLTATHYHPDHTTGAVAFPPKTTVILSKDLEHDLKEFGASIHDEFRRLSPYFEDLLKDSPYPTATVSFDKAIDIDLGGVSVRAIATGPNHTRGDTLFLVKPDNVLFTGDVVMDEAPQIASPYSCISHWLDSLDSIQAINPSLIVPDHRPMGSLTLLVKYRAYYRTILKRSAAIRQQRKTVGEAVVILRNELKPSFKDTAYPGIWSWEDRMAGSVVEAYKEAEVSGCPRPPSKRD
jgi:glyoxylase-like metal-dependent hydrolase (beta-lactamase superfamily II)